MARLQQKTCGRRAKRERLDAEHVRECLNSAIEKKGITLPRFGQMDLRPPGEHRTSNIEHRTSK